MPILYIKITDLVFEDLSDSLSLSPILQAHDYFVSVLLKLEPGQLEWNLRHVALLPRRNTRISQEDAELIGYRSSANSTDTRLVQVLAKTIPSIESFKAIRYHRAAFVR